MAYLTPDDIAACRAIASQPIGAVARIMREVFEATGITAEEIRSQSRERHIVRARQLVMYAAHKTTAMSLHQIGKAVRRDHSTVMHGIRAEEARRRAAQ